MSTALTASGLSKAFRRRRVLHGVDFEVAGGEIVGLLGPNGAGKSTAFNIVAGLLRGDGGTVSLNGQSLDGLPLYKRAQAGLGYLPQEATVFRGLSVEDNFVAAFEARGQKRADCKAAVSQLIADFHLETVEASLGGTLSGGERRRVEMARALIPDPKVVLLDEPFAGLDPIAVSEIKGFIASIRDRGIGVLLTDHNVRETLGICDRAYLISDGRILMQGTPDAIAADEGARTTYLGTDFRL